ncbi:hypothetical protein C5S36_10940 [Candidatus Methanophagaceae archaeon]|nr:hypothetical protein C5S36_10940 [Methanophagales archaeon]
MIGKHFGKNKYSSRGWYIRSSSDLRLNWNDMRSIADIPKLSAMLRRGTTCQIVWK